MFDIPKIDNREIEELLKAGKRGKSIIASLAKNIKFVDTFNTDIGRELLKDLVEMGDHALMVISDPYKEATVAERVRYSIIVELINNWSSRINSYLVMVGEIKNKQPSVGQGRSNK